MEIELETASDTQQQFNMNRGDRAIREILHLLEDKTDFEPGDNPTQKFLRHAIVCASLLCLVLFITIIIVHRKYSRLSGLRSSRSAVTTSRQENTKDTVIVITDDNNVDTEIVCDNSDDNMTATVV